MSGDVLDELAAQLAAEESAAASAKRTQERRDGRVIDLDVPFSEDPIAQAIVNEHGALTLEHIGDLCGLTRERIRQIESKAMDHFAANAAKLGFHDLAETIAEIMRRDCDPLFWSDG